MNTNTILTGICVLATSSFAMADGIDAWVQLDGSDVVIGGANDETGETFPGVRVFEAEFGVEGTPNFIDDPGFFANNLPAGTQIGFSITEPVRVWDGTFDTIADETITAHQAFGIPGSQSVTSPTSFGVRVPGFVSSVADSNGFFDEHPGYELNAPSGDGIYLFTLVVENRDGSDVLGRSLPIHFLFGNNAPESEIELAEDFVNDNLATLPTPGGAALALIGGGAMVRRRRG